MHEHRFKNDISRLRDPQRLQRLEVDRVVNLSLEGLTPHNVLDVGIGSGVFAEQFSKCHLTVAGVDPNPGMLAAARQFVPYATLKQAEAESLPFDDAQFDLVFMGVVLHETDDPVKALREARRVARQRVAVLEWPYVEQEFGPALEHRLTHEKILSLALEAGLGDPDFTPLTTLRFYRFDIP